MESDDLTRITSTDQELLQDLHPLATQAPRFAYPPRADENVNLEAGQQDEPLARGEFPRTRRQAILSFIGFVAVFVGLSIGSCMWPVLLGPPIGAAILPDNKPLHRYLASGPLFHAALAGSALVGTITGLVGVAVCLRLSSAAECWTQGRRILSLERARGWVVMVVHMTLLASASLAVGIVMVRGRYPLPEGTSVGDSLVLALVGQAVLVLSAFLLVVLTLCVCGCAASRSESVA